MKRLLAYIFMVSLVMSVGHAGDTVDYSGGSSFTKARQVAEDVFAASISVPVTNTFVNLPRTALSVLVINDDTTATDKVYVNPTGAVALNIDSSTGTTVAGSAALTLGISVAANDIRVGQLITLDEGDANDGVYSVVKLNGTTGVLLDRNCTVTNTGDQDFTIQSVPVKGGGLSMSFDVGSKVISLIADTAATPVRLIVTYQKNS